MFVTVFYAIMNIKTGLVTYCNAGHNPPYLLKHDGKVLELPMSQDPMVGAIEGIEYHTHQLQIDRGDSLVLFTDGVNEAMNKDNEQFGDNRLTAVLEKVCQSNCQQVIDAIKDAVTAFVNGAEPSDDITILSLKRL
jgi:sigma-B regulation protein RsbU (phosphoserine phosphatase)